jgi:hypothetical protein
MVFYVKLVRSISAAVIAVLFTPTRRIGFAVALSALIHAVILWLPFIHFPHSKVQLPPLTVRLELLPALEAMPEAVAQADVQPELVTQALTPGGKASGKPATNTAATLKKMEKSSVTQQFPKHVQLTFGVYRGEGVFRVGEIRHQLDIQSDRYSLIAVKQTAGLSSLVSGDQLTQFSQGKIGEHGLQPRTFKEEKTTSGSKQNVQVTFDWEKNKLHFSQGSETELPSGAQDVLSFMYQLSQLSMQQEIIPLFISNGAQLEKYEIEIGRAEEISTPFGKMSALHLRKMHLQDEAYFEIWLGLEYRLLPVKFSQVDGSGQVIEEYIISDIRAKDDI